jgi:hypothetical protein
MKKGSSTHFHCEAGRPSVVGTSNGTFITDKVGDIEISFVEYLASKKVRLQPDIVEYSRGDQAPMYDLIIGKQTCMT